MAQKNPEKLRRKKNTGAVETQRNLRMGAGWGSWGTII